MKRLLQIQSILLLAISSGACAAQGTQVDIVQQKSAQGIYAVPDFSVSIPLDKVLTAMTIPNPSTLENAGLQAMYVHGPGSEKAALLEDQATRFAGGWDVVQAVPCDISADYDPLDKEAKLDEGPLCWRPIFVLGGGVEQGHPFLQIEQLDSDPPSFVIQTYRTGDPGVESTTRTVGSRSRTDSGKWNQAPYVVPNGNHGKVGAAAVVQMIPGTVKTANEISHVLRGSVIPLNMRIRVSRHDLRIVENEKTRFLQDECGGYSYDTPVERSTLQLTGEVNAMPQVCMRLYEVDGYEVLATKVLTELGTAAGFKSSVKEFKTSAWTFFVRSKRPSWGLLPDTQSQNEASLQEPTNT